MIELKVRIEGLEKTREYIENRGKQARFAAAVALTRTAQDVQREIPAALEKALDRPTTFTKNGTFVSRADRQTLQAVVGFRDRQAEYLKFQIAGGTRTPGPAGLKLPSAIQVNDFGNIPRGLIAKLVAAARKQKGLTRRIATRIKVSNKVDLFFGDPADVGGRKFPRGIYKDVDLGGRRQLIPLIVFPNRPAKYKPRFDFKGLAERIVRDRWQRNFDQAYADALRTAR